MKSIYWHRKFLPKYIIVAFCLFMLLSLFIVEQLKIIQEPYYQQKIEAAELAHKSFEAISQLYWEQGYQCELEVDPVCSGLIGVESSPITSDSGDLTAKRTSVNPNFAALFVDWFKQLKLKTGDTIAVQMTGSYPALDINMLAAIKTLELNPLIIFSAAASNYGANRVKMPWPTMYRTLMNNNYFNYEPLAVSIGGRQDSGYGMTAYGKQLLTQAIRSNHFKLLKVPMVDATNQSVKERIDLYTKAANGKDIKAYVNVGGNMASIGLKLNTDTPKIKPKSLAVGVVKSLPNDLREVNSVAVHYLKENTPVINVRKVTGKIIEQYNFPERPTTMPIVGKSKVFVHPAYREWLTILILVIDLIALVIVAFLSRKYLISYKKGAMNTDD